MDNEKIKQFITSQRQNGVPDIEIQAFLVEKGAIQQPQAPKVGGLEKAGAFGEKLGSVFGGSKIGEAIGTGIARRDVVSGKQDVALADYSSLSPEAIQRLKDKGVPTTKEEQLAEIAKGITGPNAKELTGDVLKIGSNFVGLGAGGLAVNSAKTVGGAILRGAGGGAVTGAIEGVARGMQEDKSTKDILKQGAGGAVTGAVIGGVVGGATKGITNAIANKSARQEQKILNNITPNTNELTPTEYKDLLARGKISPKTATQPAQYILSDREKAVALSNANLIKKDPVETINNISGEIARQDANVGQYLKTNNGIFNKGELKNYLRSSIDDISDVAVDDKILSKNKDKFVNNFIKGVDKNDLHTLWESRKAFDQQIEKAFGSSTLSNKMKVELRNAVQDFISTRTDNVTYKTAMSEMSGLFDLRDTVAGRATKERARSAIQQWLIENPTKAKIIGGISAGAVAKKLGII